MEWKEDFSSRLYRNSCKSNATKKNRNIDLSILPLFSTFQIVREKKKIKGKKKIVVLEKENLSVEDTRRERNSTKRYIYIYIYIYIYVQRISDSCISTSFNEITARVYEADDSVTSSKREI